MSFSSGHQDLRNGHAHRHPPAKHANPSGKAPKPAMAKAERPAVVATRFGVETVVKWFNESKGYGFAKDPNGGKDIFIHKSILAQANITYLADGHYVVLDCGMGSKGFEATSIRLV